MAFEKMPRENRSVPTKTTSSGLFSGVRGIRDIPLRKWSHVPFHRNLQVPSRGDFWSLIRNAGTTVY